MQVCWCTTQLNISHLTKVQLRIKFTDTPRSGYVQWTDRDPRGSDWKMDTFPSNLLQEHTYYLYTPIYFRVYRRTSSWRKILFKAFMAWKTHVSGVGAWSARLQMASPLGA